VKSPVPAVVARPRSAPDVGRRVAIAMPVPGAGAREAARVIWDGGKVEVLTEVSEDVGFLPNTWPWIRPSVGLGIESGTIEEDVLDELEVGVKAQRLLDDESFPRVGTDDQTGTRTPSPFWSTRAGLMWS
jgi:hypothetical protein